MDGTPLTPEPDASPDQPVEGRVLAAARATIDAHRGHRRCEYCDDGWCGDLYAAEQCMALSAVRIPKGPMS